MDLSNKFWKGYVKSDIVERTKKIDIIVKRVKEAVEADKYVARCKTKRLTKKELKQFKEAFKDNILKMCLTDYFEDLINYMENKKC